MFAERDPAITIAQDGGAIDSRAAVRPMCRPSSWARRMPARTRSMIRLRSSSAMAPMMTTTARPSGPPVSIVLAEADELDVEPVQLVEHFEEVPDRSGDPIEGPDQDDIEAAAAGIAHQLIETRPLRLGAADPVGVLSTIS